MKSSAFTLLAAVSFAACSARAADLLGSYSAQLTAPSRIAVDSSANLLVTDPGGGKILVFDPFGRIASVRTNFNKPVSVAVDPSGKIYVGDAANGSVSVLDSQWNFLRKLGAGDGEFTMPNFIAFDPSPGSNTAFVADSSTNLIKVYYNGNFAFSFGGYGSGSGQFDFPAGISSTTNRLFVVDQKNDRVEIFDHAGNCISEFSLVIQIAQGLFGLAGGRSQGIAGDAAGRLYIADAFQDFVKIFDTQGNYLSALGGFGTAPGQLRTPTALAFDPLNRLFVASPNNGRVELFGIDSYIHLAASPSGDFATAGSNLTFSVSGPGATNALFQWRKDGTNLVNGGGISGATNSTLTVAGPAPSDSGNYSLLIAGPNGTNIWAASAITVLAPPIIASSPASQAVALGSNPAFTVAATGDAISYQWFCNGDPVAGATNSILQLSGVTPASGGGYSVTVQNAVGSAVSAAAALTVIAPPEIVLNPSSCKAVRGSTTAFDVGVQGDQLAFAWRYNGTPYFAPSSPLLILPNVQPPAAGLYSVIVTNIAGAVTSAVASLSVLIPPGTQLVSSVSMQPDNSLLFQLIGDAGYTYAFDASSDLDIWTTLTNITSQTGIFTFTERDTTNNPVRFYRLRWRP